LIDHDLWRHFRWQQNNRLLRNFRLCSDFRRPPTWPRADEGSWEGRWTSSHSWSQVSKAFFTPLCLLTC
jgi:hypothetical protein